KPKVGVKIVAAPPLNCANTGAPARPSAMYTNIVKAPSRLPSTRPDKIAKKVGNVIGTQPPRKKGAIDGMFARIAVKETNKASNVIRSAAFLFVMLKASVVYCLAIIFMVNILIEYHSTL